MRVAHRFARSLVGFVALQRRVCSLPAEDTVPGDALNPANATEETPGYPFFPRVPAV